MTAPSAASTVQSNLAEKIKVIAAVLGMFAAIAGVATFAGLKPEKRKMLEWEYVSKSSLVNESAAAGDKIQVFYDSAPIKQLTAITGRLTNTGSVPIDGNDVKDGVFPHLTFGQKVIGAEIKGLNPRGIKAELKSSASVVQIVHGLLNPGDTISVQILLEGDPGEVNGLPTIECRIADISQPSTRYPTVSKPKVGVTYFSFAPAMEYSVLIGATAAPLLCFFVGVFLISEMKSSLFPERPVLKALSDPTKALIPNDARPVHEQIAGLAFTRLPPPFDDKARTAIRENVSEPGESATDYIERIMPILKAALPKGFSERVRLLSKSEAFAMVVFFVGGVAACLILVGSWHRLITNS